MEGLLLGVVKNAMKKEKTIRQKIEAKLRFTINDKEYEFPCKVSGEWFDILRVLTN